MFEQLRGRTVVLTRDPADNAELASRLRTGGVRVVELPCVRAEPLADVRDLDAELAALREQDWLVVTSRHGASAVARCAAPRSAVAAIGDATAARLRAHGLPVTFQPNEASGTALARELPRPIGVVLLARSDRALPDLPTQLRERGASVREVVAYHTVVGARGDVAQVRALLDANEPVAVVFHSPSAVDGMVGAIDPSLVARAAVHAAGQTTLRAARAAFGAAADISLIREEVAHAAHR